MGTHVHVLPEAGNNNDVNFVDVHNPKVRVFNEDSEMAVYLRKNKTIGCGIKGSSRTNLGPSFRSLG